MNFENKIKNEICANLPNAFWHRKQHIISLPYESDFNERNIPTKTRPIQMNQELLEYCKKEIQELLNKGLIRKSKSLGVVLLFMFKRMLKLIEVLLD